MTSTAKSRSKKNLALVDAAAVTAGVFLLAVAGTLSVSSAQLQGQGQEQEEQRANSASQNITTTVEVGGGGPTPIVMAFTPQNVTINVGQTVVWTNPTVVPEPHTVSFIRQQGHFPFLESAYLIANGTQLPPANPNEQNTEALVIPGQNGTTTNNIIVAANARATNPVVINAQNNVTYLPPNANYTMTGDELYVNSGFMWPKGLIPPGASPITSFSIKFESAGTYDYVCVIHPWMTGQVVVQ
jgi:plastocyanin